MANSNRFRTIGSYFLLAVLRTETKLQSGVFQSDNYNNPTLRTFRPIMSLRRRSIDAEILLYQPLVLRQLRVLFLRVLIMNGFILVLLSTITVVVAHEHGAPCASQYTMHPNPQYHGPPQEPEEAPVPYYFSITDNKGQPITHYRGDEIYTG